MPSSEKLPNLRGPSLLALRRRAGGVPEDLFALSTITIHTPGGPSPSEPKSLLHKDDENPNFH